MHIFFVKFFLRGYEMEKFKSVDELVSQLKPVEPYIALEQVQFKKLQKFSRINFQVQFYMQ